jgi:hypothetical protein
MRDHHHVHHGRNPGEWARDGIAALQHLVHFPQAKRFGSSRRLNFIIVAWNEARRESWSPLVGRQGGDDSPNISRAFATCEALCPGDDDDEILVQR